MKIVSVDKIQEGDLLGKSIFNQRGELLLAAGYKFTRDMISLVRYKGFQCVYLQDEATRDIIPEEVISETVRQVTRKTLSDSYESVKKYLDFTKMTSSEVRKRLREDEKFHKLLQIPAIRKQVRSILDEIIENQVTMLTTLSMKSRDGQEFEHALDTTVLSILIGREFNYDFKNLSALGLAAMVHDVGKLPMLSLAEKNLNELTPKERVVYREHPSYSYLILQGAEPEAFREQAAVLQHHEQENGRGFPQQLEGFGLPPKEGRGKDQGYIHRFAEIIAVVNAYDNLLSGRTDGKNYLPGEAILAIITGRAGSWNKHVMRVLSRIVQCFPVGTTVRILKNHSKTYLGYLGVVAKANPDDQTKPQLVLTHNAREHEIKPRLVDFAGEEYMDLELVL